MRRPTPNNGGIIGQPCRRKHQSAADEAAGQPCRRKHQSAADEAAGQPCRRKHQSAADEAAATKHWESA
uniref:Uncharacterized protein n=1 Tax=Oryza sativa subsp. japonica TaxID=39947 RepID=Q75KT0_ORYSJ|nr:hypothetical protein [Oryza sativa Japonica Group]